MTGHYACVSALFTLVGCQFEPSGSARSGTGDVGPEADQPDAAFEQLCADWVPAAPFDPCEVMARGGDLVLQEAGLYVYDTTDGVLRRDGGDPIDHASQILDSGVRLVAAAAFIVGPDAVLRVEGGPPLLIASWSVVEIAGTLDAGSSPSSDGAGANPDTCPPRELLAGGLDPGGGGGGGGGGLLTPGGVGGDGGALLGVAGAPGPAVEEIALRGGCPGGSGGASAAELAPAEGGGGGGAVALSARERLSVTGRLLAAGSSGSGGATSGGGAGGGSGGLVWLDARSIALGADAVLSANGGGGGEAGDVDDTGNPGDAPHDDGARLHGGRGGANDGGDGGDAVADRDASGKSGKAGRSGGDGGGGGGGGGGGLVRWTGAIEDAGARITPDPSAPGVITHSTTVD